MAGGYAAVMAKWQLSIVVAFVVIFGVTVILTGNPVYVIAAVMIAALVIGWALLNRVMTKRVAGKHESIGDAMSDESEPIPSTHLIPDNVTAAGDTPEAHDEINPHDIPAGHPGREAAEAQAERAPRDEGARTTRGDDERVRAAPKRAEHLERATRGGASPRAGGAGEQRNG
jgi:hypothetical protein